MPLPLRNPPPAPLTGSGRLASEHTGFFLHSVHCSVKEIILKINILPTLDRELHESQEPGCLVPAVCPSLCSTAWYTVGA